MESATGDGKLAPTSEDTAIASDDCLGVVVSEDDSPLRLTKLCS